MAKLIDQARRLLGSRSADADASMPDSRGSETPHSTEGVRAYYEAMTPAYLAGFGAVFQGSRPDSTEELLDYLTAALDLRPGFRLLDAGCGVAGPAIGIAQRCDVSIDGITLAQVQADEAQARIAAAGLADRVRVTRHDFATIGELYPEPVFDRVMFLESLCHAQDYRVVLAGAHRALKSGGALYIKDFYAVDHRSRPAVHQKQAGDLAKLSALYHMQVPDLASLVDLVGELGFLIRFVRMPEYDSTYRHWAKFEQVALRSWNPTSGQPGEVIQGIELFCWKI